MVNFKRMKYGFILSFFLLMGNGLQANEKAHVHGSVEMSVALENEKSGEVSFDIPGESVFGFEHKAKTKKEKAAVEAGLLLLRAQASKIVFFPEVAKCTITDPKSETEKGEHSGHGDVTGSFRFSCESSLDQMKLKSGLFNLLPKVRSISLQVLTNSKQTKSILKSANDDVVISK
jgi:hypothetical protein